MAVFVVLKGFAAICHVCHGYMEQHLYFALKNAGYCQYYCQRPSSRLQQAKRKTLNPLWIKRFHLVEHRRLELLTPTLPVLCATNCANAPWLQWRLPHQRDIYYHSFRGL